MAEMKTKNNMIKTVKNFAVANCWMFWIALFLFFGYDMYVNNNLTEKIYQAADDMEKSRKQFSKGVVMLDIMGRPVVSNPQELTPLNPAFQQSIVNYIKLYGIYDWATFRINESTAIRKADDAYERIKKIKLFADNFLEVQGQARQDYIAYLTKTIFLMNQNKLPEKVSIIDEAVSSFIVDGNEFNTKITFKVHALIYDGNTEKYIQKEGYIVVEAIGTLDPSQANMINPLGIKFTKKYKPTVLTK